MSELFTLGGSITNTGVVSLTGDLLYSTVAYLRIPKGYRAKIWAKRLNNPNGTAAAVVRFEKSPDVTVNSPTWAAIGTELATSSEVVVEKRRPIVFRSLTGKEGLRVNVTSAPTDSTTSVELEIEVARE
jgi:hypothetical protein